MLLKLCSALLLLSLANCHEPGEDEFDFDGKVFWGEENMKQCNAPKNTPYTESYLECYIYYRSFYPVRLEVLSMDPILIVYKNFATEEEIEDFLHDAKQKQMEQQKTVGEEGIEVMHSSRVANGTWLEHRETYGTAKLFDKAEAMIPNVNFNAAESWQVLSYHPGGHYAPHYDHIKEADDNKIWRDRCGQRYATFLLILQTADGGGGTVFPIIEATVQPEAGDVLFWTNINGKGEMHIDSLHGACPILKGEKIAATLWIRERGQENLLPIDDDGFFDIDYLTHPGGSFTMF